MSTVLGVVALTVLVIAWLLTVPCVDIDVSLSQLQICWLLHIMIYAIYTCMSLAWIYIYIPDMVCILTVPCVDVSTVPGMDVWTLPHMVYILTVPCMEMSTVPGVDGSVHALTALYNYGLHYWQPHVWMLTVPGVDVLTVADMVVVLAVLTGVNVLVVTGMGVLSVAGSRLLGLCFPSVSPIGIISVFPSAVSMKYFDVCVFSLIYLSNKSSDNIAVVIPCCSTGERQSWFRVLVA